MLYIFRQLYFVNVEKAFICINIEAAVFLYNILPFMLFQQIRRIDFEISTSWIKGNQK